MTAGMPPASARSSMWYFPDGPDVRRPSASSRAKRSKSSRSSGTPARPAIAGRWTTAFVEPPSAIKTRMAFSKAGRPRIRDGRRSSRAISTIRRPAASASRRRRESGAGIAAIPGSVMPRASVDRGHGAGGPHHHARAGRREQLALDRLHAEPRRSCPPGARPRAPAVRARAEPHPLVAAGEHRAGGHDDRGPVRAGRAHQLGGEGLVAAAEEHHAVHGLAEDHLLGVHRHEVAEEHARRATGRSRRARSSGTRAAGRPPATRRA